MGIPYDNEESLSPRHSDVKPLRITEEAQIMADILPNLSIIRANL
jgi:hypothetical protein